MKFFPVAVLIGFATASVIPNLGSPVSVTNGTNATQKQAPFLVRLDIKIGDENFRCGGTIVDKTTVITAAHCVETSDPKEVVSVDAYYGSVSVDNKQHVHAKKITMHPKYDTKTLANDIAILEAPEIKLKAGETESIRIYNGKIKADQEMRVYGWGLKKNGGSADDFPKTLLTGLVYVSKPKACTYIESTYKGADGPQICTDNNRNAGVDVCNGDSGTGTTITSSGKQYYAGLVSYGRNPSGEGTCGEAGDFGMYTHVYHYLSWIETTIGHKLQTGP